MKRGLVGLLSLLVVAVLTGCGGGAPEPEEGATTTETQKVESAAGAEGSGTATPMKKEEAAEHAHDDKAEHAHDEAAAAKPAEGSDTADHAAMMKGGLKGTTWDYQGIVLSFKEGNKVFLKGGPLAALAPDGTEADYTLKDGVFEVSVLGQTYSGTYADGTLTVDGTEAVMQ
ncbi:MAG: hypothetical protein L3K26_07315 [Candidatus Hydrogenedentes bacterium]|nr:hypothetical protein [Candidatus Hydrogenedentota bacterium]